MVLRRTLALLAMTLLLAGCYRQADDSFQTVNNNQGAPTAQTIDVTPTDTTPIINPNEETATPEDATPVIIEEASPTESIVIVEGEDTATPTVVIIEETNTPQALTAPTELPTATPPTLPTVITPGQGNPPQVTLPTSTPGGTPTQAPPGSDLQPTPTDLAIIADGECTVEVASGDNLYRIALRNGVELADLLSANSLSETSIIQPGELLKIPNCVPSGDGGQVSVPTTAPGSGIPEATPFPSDVTVHTVASGETLTTIARQYGVSLQQIIDTNKLTNPDRLSIGQQLIIPAQP